MCLLCLSKCCVCVYVVKKLVVDVVGLFLGK